MCVKLWYEHNNKKKRKQAMNMQVIAWRAGDIVDDHGQ